MQWRSTVQIYGDNYYPIMRQLLWPKMSVNRIWKAWKIITFLFDLYFLTLLEKSCDTFFEFFWLHFQMLSKQWKCKNNLMHVNSYTEQKSKETILFWHEYWSDRYVFFCIVLFIPVVLLYFFCLKGMLLWMKSVTCCCPHCIASAKHLGYKNTALQTFKE